MTIGPFEQGLGKSLQYILGMIITPGDASNFSQWIHIFNLKSASDPGTEQWTMNFYWANDPQPPAPPYLPFF